MIKKVISVLLILTVLLNVIGFGFFDVKSAAIAGVDDAAISGIVLSMLGSMFGVPIQTQEMQNSKLNNLNMQALKNGEIVTVYNTGDSYRFKASDTVSEADRELAETLAEKLNEKNVAGTLTAGFVNEYGSSVNSPGTSMSANTYSAVKTDIINAYYDSLVSTMSGPIDPSQQKYKFSFTEPIQGYSVPAISNEGLTVIRDGYELSTPFTIRNVDVTFASEPKTVCGLTVSSCYGEELNYSPYLEITEGKGCHGFGFYILYNNEIYYMKCCEASSGYYTHPGICLESILYESNIQNYYTSDGKRLEDSISDRSQLVGCSAGLYFYENPNCSGRPENDISPSELVGAGTAGFLINNDISPEEGMIKEAIIAGILPEDFPIELNDRGEIVSVNGINMATIQQILTKLTTDQIKFSDVQSYLEAIKNACEGTNLDTGKIQSILNTVATQMVTAKDVNDALKDINEYLKSLSEAFTIPIEAEFELSDAASIHDADVWTIRHTGLPESKFIVDRIPIIDQCKEFLINLLDGDKYSTAPPSFSFYWDSDKDGTVEKYTALDLSFLETRLTNENLEDKRYFTSAMTVRQFIQYLIILVCYTAFVLKMLRKLPGLVSGGESAGSDFLMTEKQNR